MSKLFRILVLASFVFALGCTKKKEGSYHDIASRSDDNRSWYEQILISMGVQDEPAPQYAVPAVLHFNQVLANMELATGIIADQATRDIYREKIDVLSTRGEVSSVTAPMWMAISDLSIRICKRLVDRESTLASAERQFFVGVDFGASPANIQATTKDAIINRMSRAFWGRNEIALERADIIAGFDEANLNQANPMGGAIVMCSTMLAAIPAQES